MSKTKLISLISFTLLLVSISSAKAQRHYAGVSALEANYGLNIFGEPNTHLNFAYSKYKNRTTYWKGGFNYLENTYKYNIPLNQDISETGEIEYLRIHTTAKSYYGDVIYFKTLATNLTWLYFNGGIGAFLGVETYKSPEREHQFLLGPKIDVELECFVTSRVAIMGRLTQYWNPFSDVTKWNTVWNVGVKFLMY